MRGHGCQTVCAPRRGGSPHGGPPLVPAASSCCPLMLASVKNVCICKSGDHQKHVDGVDSTDSSFLAAPLQQAHKTPLHTTGSSLRRHRAPEAVTVAVASAFLVTFFSLCGRNDHNIGVRVSRCVTGAHALRGWNRVGASATAQSADRSTNKRQALASHRAWPCSWGGTHGHQR